MVGSPSPRRTSTHALDFAGFASSNAPTGGSLFALAGSMALLPLRFAAATQLNHQAILRTQRSGYLAGKPFRESECLSGWSLQQLMEAVRARGLTLPLPIALALATGICRGLADAHSCVDEAGIPRPIIHCDVSPATVMIGRDGLVELLDSGWVQLTDRETLSIDTLTGRLAYMAPELLDKRQVDRRTNVFALGALLYELLAGRPLFVGVDDAATIRRVQQLAIVPPSMLHAAVSPWLDAIVLRALSRDPARRYASAEEMLRALESLAAAAPPETLLQYLSWLVPDVFASACAECGAPISPGATCVRCTTIVDAVGADAAATLGTAIVPTPPSAPSAALVSPPPAQPSRFQLRLFMLWAHLHNLVAALAGAGRKAMAWLAALRLRLVAVCQQIALLWACARPRANDARNMDASSPRKR
jgi:hypothetical protein